MSAFLPPAATPLAGTLAAVLLAAGCSDPTEDVRVTLCRDIVLTQAGPDATIRSADPQTKGYEHAAVRVRFSSRGTDAVAVCYYDYAAVEDTAIELSDPLSAYATSPFEVVIDGRKMSRSGLADAVGQAMLKQGRGLLQPAKE
jgi:hypothetical protein